LIIDSFAGGGGASTGISQALGRSVDIAINHDPAAIAMHRANHPDTYHYCEDVWEVDPRQVANGRPVALVWLSPDCKHFSKAKGGKPVEKSIRGLAWVAVRWAATVRPRVIMLENVEEFRTWGPLIPKRDKKTGRIIKKAYCSEDSDLDYKEIVSELGEIVPPDLRIMYPDPNQKGRTFNCFVNALKRQGYQVDFRELRACDFGAPTNRKRFFMISRRDGQPIVWPEPTHGDPNSEAVKSGRLLPWRTAAEIIDWSLPCPSIFDTAAEIKAKYGIKAVRPLADNTMRRIARGVQKFVVENPNPFIMQAFGGGYTGAGSSIDNPLPTITARDHNFLVTPFLAQYHSYESNRARGQTLNRPLLTLDTSNRYALVSAFISKFYKTGIGQGVNEPLHTITTSPGHFAEVRAFLTQYYGTGTGSKLSDPLPTVVSRDRFGLVTVHGQNYQITDIGMRMLVPRELFNAQGFPGDYIIDRDFNGKAYPISAQVARCGNSVSPVIPYAMVRANLPDQCRVAA